MSLKSVANAGAVAILAWLGYASSTHSLAAAEPMSIEGAIVTLIEHAEVPARAQGPLAEVMVKEGDIVQAGQLLARIDEAEAKLATERAEIELATARREAANELPTLAAARAAEAARAELKRAVDSVAKYEKSISQSELDRLKLAAEEAEFKHRQAVHVRETAELTARVKENELRAFRHRLELHRVAAPIAGVIVEMKRRRGDWVEAGMPVVRLVRMDRLRIEAFYDVNRLPADAVGRSVRLRVARPDAPPVEYEGRITFVNPEVNPVNGQVRLWAEVENRDGSLRPGMQGTLVFGSAAATAIRPAGQKS